MNELEKKAIIHSYFQQKDILIRHQIDSYNDYIDNIIPNIIEQFFPNEGLNIECEDPNNKIKNIKLKVNLPDGNILKEAYCIENNGVQNILTPELARLRNYTYSAPLYINMTISVTVNENGNSVILPDNEIKNILLGKIPIMVNSKYCMGKKVNTNNCKYDLGGYMIINGNEKVIISQERIANNIIQVFKNNKNNTKFSYLSECRSCNEDVFNIPKLTSIKITNKPDKFNNNIYVNIPNIKQEIPLIILFRLLGCLSDKEIIYNIIDNSNEDIDDSIVKVLLPSFENTQDIRTQNEAYRFLFNYLNKNYNNISCEKKMLFIKNNIIKNILPHIANPKKKLLFLGLMVNKLIKCYLGILETDDRDSYYHKRIDTPGILMGSLTYLCINKIVKDIKLYINKEISSGICLINKDLSKIINETNISKIIKSSYIETTLKSSLATGSWGIKTGSSDRAGVSQVLNRLTYSSCISHLRRVATTADVTGKLIPPRKLHATSWGMICPTETPEGQSVGLVKNLAICCNITNKSSSEPVKYILKDKIENIEDIDIYKFNKYKSVLIFINGDIYGYTHNIQDIISYLKICRKDGIISTFISFYMDYTNNSFYILSDRGRCCRPLFTVKNNKLLYNKKIYENINNGNISWNDLVLKYKIIEYIDISEVNNTLICTYPKDLKNKNYTHCEICPSLILGIVASGIPFAHHNQSPRNTYQSAMGKQAIGIHSTKYNNRYDTFSHILFYPQKPLITTRYMKYFNADNLPSGINCIVAIASYSGYNQEDSVILNKAAIERGLFSSTFYRCYREEEKKNQLTGDEDIFCKPDINNILFPKQKNYNKLEKDGFIKKDTYVDDNDIIIGKIMPIRNSEYRHRDTSISVKNNEKGYIDSIYINTNGDGFKFCKVRIRSTKYPEIGDKFSSRHGQKGTCGIIYEQCDMPYTKDGIVPDIIVNPHAIPSRMTIAQLLECILGKTCVMSGHNGDGTVFNNTNAHDISDALQSFGFERNGNEVLYSGFNGEQLKTSIFIGPTYYQRLKHMSGDKVHSRASGPVVSMTRQPAEGRSSHGGLRFGEMERDCIIAHGGTSFLKERLMDVSDKFACYTCNICGNISVASPNNNIYSCKKCNNYNKFTKINIPYSCKLLIQELQSMSLNPRFMIK
jgi:DNA-directed RNA polymerase II subunit RPB2